MECLNLFFIYLLNLVIAFFYTFLQLLQALTLNLLNAFFNENYSLQRYLLESPRLSSCYVIKLFLETIQSFQTFTHSFKLIWISKLFHYAALLINHALLLFHLICCSRQEWLHLFNYNFSLSFEVMQSLNISLFDVALIWENTVSY